jgi:tetratricopeptide (TPR) repeat protein
MARVTDAPTYARHFVGGIERSVHVVALRLDALENNATIPAALLKQVLHTISFAFDVKNVWPDLRNILMNMAHRMEKAGHRDDWRPYLEHGIAASVRFQDPKTEAALRYHLGMLHEVCSRFQEADAAYKQSAETFAQLSDQRNTARSLTRCAYIHRLRRDFPNAEALVTQALSLLEPDDPERADCEFTLGTLAYDKRQWGEAEAHLRAAVSIWEKTQDPYRIALSLRNLGPALHSQGRLDEAIQCYETALLLLEENPDPLHKSGTYMNLGIAYSLKGETESALAAYGQAERIFRLLHDDLRLARLYTNLAIEHQTHEHWQAAESYCFQASHLWQKLGNTRSVINVMDVLALTYLGLDRPQRASEVLHDALALLDTIPDDPDGDRLRQTLLEDLEGVRRDMDSNGQ